MADGVIRRIEGDDAPFQKTLAGIEPAVQAALRGVSASAAAVLRGISAQMEAADFAGAGSAAMDALAAGMRGNPATHSAALSVARSAALAMNQSAAAASAGRSTAQGLANGILSGRGAVVAAARTVARAAAAAMRSELQIHSPSRVTERLGEMTGQGFELGMVESLNDAIRSAQGIVGSMNLTPRLSAPDLSSAFASAAGSIADAEGARPIYLNVNGRTLATVTAADTRRAQNSYNRTIALGVGK